jgi:hypothetical protein
MINGEFLPLTDDEAEKKEAEMRMKVKVVRLMN